jgi:uncharacterized protein YjiS (DUF1127 family)
MSIERTITSPAGIFVGAISGRTPSLNLADVAVSAFRAAVDAYERGKTVRELNRLSDHLLDDIGLDRFGLDQATRVAISDRNRQRRAR